MFFFSVNFFQAYHAYPVFVPLFAYEKDFRGIRSFDSIALLLSHLYKPLATRPLPLIHLDHPTHQCCSGKCTLFFKAPPWSFTNLPSEVNGDWKIDLLL